ncbi:MAG TPA: PAS domain S-box protein [Gammaproteobacteria bacterium]|nr:PAS domain S-box protein [Gammaproteobacteria bacterium]
MSPQLPDGLAPTGGALIPALPLESVPAPAYACDLDGRIVAFNEKAAALWGRRPKLNDGAERFSGAETLLAPNGSLLPRESSPMARALSTVRNCEGAEAVIVRPDGTRRTVLYYAVPTHDGCATLTGATALMIDITDREEEQRAARAALENSEANFRGFFESVAVGAALVNKEGRFVSVNDRYCEITGYSRDELVTMSPFQLDHPDDKDRDLECVLTALADPSAIYQTEKRYVRKDGMVRWVHVAANFLRDQMQRPIQTVAVCLDISERKRAEQALHEADRLKDEFLATLAHELRNPLAPLKSAAELLRSADARESDWCRTVIDRQVTHLTRLIDDLLDVSRITRDKLELRKERVELEDIVTGAIEASRPTLDRCEQTLTTRLPEEPVSLHGDVVRLTQVLTNLLTNAAKFTDAPGSIELVARVDGGDVVIGVVDEGVGIASDELSRVFDKFYQSPRRGKRFLGGLGIGLSLVQRLVELHGGSVEARSAGLGHGSEFIVRLPLAPGVSEALPAKAPADAQAPASEAPAAEQRRAPRGVRVMIVDDNVDGADALGRLLAVMGHETVTEYDGQSALRRAAEFPADIILLDLGMPGMDGFEVCRRLRDQFPRERPRIVALTGWGRKEDLARTAEAGFDAHLVKPVGRKVLESLLAPGPRSGAGAGAAA